jgi:hypothetical protein
MKRNHFIFTGLLCLILPSTIPAQDQQQAPARPQYITVTTMHWNMDYEDFDMDTWKAVEKEYFDKVTSKNELVMVAGYYTHRFTADSRELLSVTGYANWEDIDKATARNQELAKEGWPDDEERKTYFKKRNAYYADFHSDEIYAPMDNAIPHDRKSTPIVLIRRNHFKFSDGVSTEEFNTHHKNIVDNVIQKNEYLKGYYPNAHVWGADRTENVEAFFVASMADLDAMFDKNEELINEKWPTDEDKDKMLEGQDKYYTGVHGDYIYTVVTELVK